MRHQHPVVAVAEVQPPTPALTQVLLVKVGWILIALYPSLDVPSGPIGGHARHQPQQLGVTVDGLGAGHPGGAGQGVGVLGGDVACRQRPGDIRHRRQRLGPPTPPLRLPLRRTRIAPQHLHGVDPAVAQPLHSGHDPSLRRIGARPHTPQRRHQPPKHAPSGALQRQRPQLNQQCVHQRRHPTRPVARTDDDHFGRHVPCARAERAGRLADPQTDDHFGRHVLGTLGPGGAGELGRRRRLHGDARHLAPGGAPRRGCCGHSAYSHTANSTSRV